MWIRLVKLAVVWTCLVVNAMVFAGCRGGLVRPERSILPPGAPEARSILSDLAANDAKIRTFYESNTVLTLSSSRLKAKQVVNAEVAFERPDKLYIVGRQRAFRTVAFRLVSVGPEYAVEVPRDREYFFSREGEKVKGVSFAVSPSEIARELFLPEDWERIAEENARVSSYDPATGQATLLLGAPRRPTRRIEVGRPDAGAPWVLLKSERLNARGHVYARSARSAYGVWDGIRFPRSIVADFPQQKTQVRLEQIDNPKFNSDDVKDALFVIDWSKYETGSQ